MKLPEPPVGCTFTVLPVVPLYTYAQVVEHGELCAEPINDLLRAVRLAAKLLGRVADRVRTVDDGEGEVHDLLLVAEDFDDLIARVERS